MFLDAGQPFPSMGNNRGMVAGPGFTLVGLVPNINEDDVGHINSGSDYCLKQLSSFRRHTPQIPETNGNADLNI
jgi:hypothetical protein